MCLRHLSTSEEFKGERDGPTVQFELQEYDKPDGTQLQQRGKKAAPPIRSEQVAPKIGIDFGVKVVHEYIH